MRRFCSRTRAVDAFTFSSHTHEDLKDPRHGAGRRHLITGKSKDGIEKRVEVTFFERLPGLAMMQVHYLNQGQSSLEVIGWRSAAHELADAPGGFWSFSGATHEDRRDWVQPLKADFDQRNSLSMAASDYGGGIPMANIWRRDVGLAVGHVEPIPRLLDLPVRKTTKGASIAIEERAGPSTLEPGQTLSTERTFLVAHNGDHFAPLTQYREFLEEEGIVAPKAPESAFAPVWCAWGYEREFTVEQIVATLPKVRVARLRVGGARRRLAEQRRRLAHRQAQVPARRRETCAPSSRPSARRACARACGSRRWPPIRAAMCCTITPTCCCSIEWGAFQTVSWWNALTQCPAYQPTIDYYVALTKKIIGDWGFEGLKLDGQHLNSVAPCYNKAHKHSHPDRVGREVRRLLEGHPQGSARGQSGGGGGALSLRHGVQLPQPAGHGSVPVLGPAHFLAGAQQGQELQGDHRQPQQPRRRSRGAFRQSRRLRLERGHRRGDLDQVHLAQGYGTSGRHPCRRAASCSRPRRKRCGANGWASTRRHMLPKGEYLGGFTTSASTSPRRHAISKDGAMYYAFYAPSYNGKIATARPGRGKLSRARPVQRNGPRQSRRRSPTPLNARFERFLLLQAKPA